MAARVPLKLVLGDNDQYYSADAARRIFDEVHEAYVAFGLSDEEAHALVSLEVKDSDYFEGNYDQHGSGNWYFAHDPEIMGWLLDTQPL